MNENCEIQEAAAFQGELLCLFGNRCECAVNEEDSIVTSVILKFGKTYEPRKHEAVTHMFSEITLETTPNRSLSIQNKDFRTANKQSLISEELSSETSQIFKKRNRRRRNIDKHKHQPSQNLNMNNNEKSELTTKCLDVSTLFRLLIVTNEQRITQRKTAAQKLKLSQGMKTKSAKQMELDGHADALLESIRETELHNLNAQFGFDRASLFADSEIRKQRELFRLNAALPALMKRKDFETAVCENQFVVVMGNTGSGKSTQLTQYLADMPQFENKMILCTQPRKIAAVTLAQRVAFEFAAGNETAETKTWVACQVGGRANTLNRNNRIKYMTETVLLNQLTRAEITQTDPFSNCAALIIDEAHSRTITTDVLLGVMKRKIHMWPDLKVIVTSATIDTSLFSKYLNNCPVIEIPGRVFPVEVVYCPVDQNSGQKIEAVVKQAITITNEHESGDVLCFLTGQNEVEWAKKKFSEMVKPKPRRAKKIVAYSLYGKQTPEEQQKVFLKTPDVQKIIFSTDIAETSVTIDGIKFIVDSGLTKNLVFDSTRNITSLKEMMISSASAEQRKGRAGRTRAGICYRMYSEDEYNSMEKYDKAEIFLRPLSITVTLLKAIRVDPLNFQWLEEPDRLAIEAATEELCLLGALDHRQSLTPLGVLISELQIDPGIAHMINHACSKGLGKVASLLAGLFSVTSMVFWRGGEDETRQAADEVKKNFVSERGDIFTCYQVFVNWLDLKKADPSMKAGKAWCKENYINNKAMNMALTTAQEIEQHLTRDASHIWMKTDQRREPTSEELQQIIAQAFVLNVAYRVSKNYMALRAGTMTYIHPGSVFFSGKDLPKAITFQNILRTSKTFAVQITPIDMEWLERENGALHAMYEERAANVNVQEVRVTPVSRGILGYILGPANRNVDILNRELDCLVHGDYENDALVAWCKPNATVYVYNELTRRVDSRKEELELESREDSIIGETRVVWGCGGEAKMMLFHGDFVGVNIVSIPSSWNLNDVNNIVRQRLSQPVRDSIRDIFFTSKKEIQQKQCVRIIFDQQSNAASALKELCNERLPAQLIVSPALGNRPSVFKESEAWLEISFAIATSQKSAIIIYDSMEDANSTITSRCLGFRPSRHKEDGTNKPNMRHNPAVEGGFFVQQSNPFNVKMSYALYANKLYAQYDEDYVENMLSTYGCPKPSYVKIIRGSELVSGLNNASPAEADALLLNYASSNRLLPLFEKVKQTIVRRDRARKKVTIRAMYNCMDDLEMIRISQLVPRVHLDHPVKMKFQLKTSLRLDKKLWAFQQNAIQLYLENLREKNVSFTLGTKSIAHVWIHLEIPSVNTLDEIRKNLDRILEFQFYKHPKIQLLFTRYGFNQLTILVKASTSYYIHVNTSVKTIRIYGKELERQQAVNKLQQLLESLEALQLDVPLIIRKNSLTHVGNNLKKFYNEGLRGDLQLSYNRLFVNGTREGIETLRDTLKNHLVEHRNLVAKGDCGICLCPLEGPIFLQLCAHKYCLECIKAMVDQQITPYPIVCPAEQCGVKLCLKDIQLITPVGTLEKMAEAAVRVFQQNNPNTFQMCFKNGCEQYVPIKESVPEEREQTRFGGNVVFCDQCNLHYCTSCSISLKEPVERHKGFSCTQRQACGNKDVAYHRLFILDEICMLRCPRCKTAFDDFDGCCALSCSVSSCRANFCYFCLTDCGTDAHSHVRQCNKNPNGDSFYINAAQKNTVHKEYRKSAIVSYLMKTCQCEKLRSAVLHSIVKDLKDLEIIINPYEVHVSDISPLFDSSKHRQHILDEICTLRCPCCSTAFIDFEGCSALTCWNEQCKSLFCFFCLEGFKDDEQKCYAHVIKCPENVVPGQLATPTGMEKSFNRNRCKKRIIEYLKLNCPNSKERETVVDSIAANLRELGIVIRKEDFVIPPVASARPRSVIGRPDHQDPYQGARPRMALYDDFMIPPERPNAFARPRLDERPDHLLGRNERLERRHAMPQNEIPPPKKDCVFL